MMGQLQSNWKKLEPDPPSNDERGDYWDWWSSNGKELREFLFYTQTTFDWRWDISEPSRGWTTPGAHGPKDTSYTQRLVEYPNEQPLPDGVSTCDNNFLSWAFKRDYLVSWIHQDPTTITSSTWWDATGKEFTGGHEGPPGMDAILCAVNIFGQDDTYRLPEGQKGAVYNAYCRKNSGEITYWSVDYSIGKCLVKFADGISKTKRDSGSWVGWKVESVQMVDDDARFEKTI